MSETSSSRPADRPSTGESPVVAVPRDRLRVVLLVLVATFSSWVYWVTMRCLLDDPAFRWQTSLGTAEFGGNSWIGDFPLLFLMYAFLLSMLYLGWRRPVFPFHGMVLVWTGVGAIGVVYKAVTAPERYRFRGDTAGIDISLAKIAPPIAVTIFLIALVWVVRDVRRRRALGAKPVAYIGWTKVNRGALFVALALLPAQWLAFHSGEPHGPGDGIGLIFTLAQWFLLHAALVPWRVSPRFDIASTEDVGSGTFSIGAGKAPVAVLLAAAGVAGLGLNDSPLLAQPSPAERGGTTVTAAQSEPRSSTQEALDLEGLERRELERRVAEQPSDAEARLALVERLLRVGASASLTATEEVAETARELALEHAQAATELSSDDPDTWYWLGEACVARLGDVNLFGKASLSRRARASYRRALDLDAAHSKSHEGLLSYYMNAPAIGGGGQKPAMAQAQELSAVDPVGGALARARVLRRFDDDEDASKVLAELTRSAPNRVEVWLEVGFDHQHNQRWSDAARAFDRALELDPEEPMALYQAGRNAVLSGAASRDAIDDALERFRAYLELPPERGNPSLASAHWRVAQLLERSGDVNGARAEVSLALRLDPDHGPARELADRLE